MQKKRNLFSYANRRVKKWLCIGCIIAMIANIPIRTHANVLVEKDSVKIEESNVSLADLLDKLDAEMVEEFIYLPDDLEQYENLSVNVEGRVEDVLTEILKDTDLELKVLHDAYVISKKEVDEKELKNEQEDKKFIKGKVVDDMGLSLPGVSIIVKGTAIGTATDINGNYSLEIPVDSKVLVFSFIGMQTKEVVYSGQMLQNVSLSTDAEQMSEVMVTGYQTISKERATGSFDIVDNKILEEPVLSISNKLIGSIAGLQSAGGDLQIRGLSALNSNKSPLIVVDGFPYNGNLDMLNSDNIENITILKDAASASIYGARSGNGVIVITTKQAKTGKFKVDFSAKFQTEDDIDYDYYFNRSSSSDQIDFDQLAFDNNHFGNDLMPSDNFANATHKGASLATVLMNENQLGYLSDEELKLKLDNLRGKDNTKELADLFFQRSLTQNYNLHVNGSTDKFKHALDLMYRGNKGREIGVENKRYVIDYKTTASLHKNVDVYLNTFFQIVENKGNNAGGEFKSIGRYNHILNEDGSYNDIYRWRDQYKPLIQRHIENDNASFAYDSWLFNPLQERRSSRSRSDQTNVKIQSGIKVKLLEGLELNSGIQFEKYKTDSDVYYSDESYFIRNWVNITSTPEEKRGAIIYKNNIPKGGIFDGQKYATKEVKTFKSLLKYVKNINKHRINFIAGTEYSVHKNTSKKYPRIVGYDSKKNTASTYTNGSGEYVDWMGIAVKDGFRYLTNTSFGYNKKVYYSVFSNMAYTYDDKYSLSFSYRNDASNLISDDPAIRYSPFWSVGSSWQIHREKFLKNVKSINRLLLRATYGYNGNVSNSSAFKPLISYSSQYGPAGGVNVATIRSYGNPTLRWEKIGNLNLGIDYVLFNNKLRGKIDYYRKKGEDLYASVSLVSVHGTTNQRFNAAGMINNGIEISLGTTQKILGNDIVFDGDLNFSYNKNEITELNKFNFIAEDMVSGGSSQYAEGHNANVLWAYRYGGMKNFGTEEISMNQPTYLGPEGNKVSLNQKLTTDGRDFLSAEGTSVAPYLLNFNSRFKIYDFELSFLITSKFGHKFRRTTFDYPSYQFDRSLNSKYSEVKKSDGSDMIPLSSDDYTNDWRFRRKYAKYMDYLITDAGFIDFKKINLSYNLPKRISRKLKLSKVKFFVQCNNVGTVLFNKYNEHPEHKLGRIKPVKSYTFGTNIKF